MRKMLIVDDDAHIRNLVMVYAQLEGFQCGEAENADQAAAGYHADGPQRGIR